MNNSVCVICVIYEGKKATISGAVSLPKGWILIETSPVLRKGVLKYTIIDRHLRRIGSFTTKVDAQDNPTIRSGLLTPILLNDILLEGGGKATLGFYIKVEITPDGRIIIKE